MQRLPRKTYTHQGKSDEMPVSKTPRPQVRPAKARGTRVLPRETSSEYVKRQTDRASLRYKGFLVPPTEFVPNRLFDQNVVTGVRIDVVPGMPVLSAAARAAQPDPHPAAVDPVALPTQQPSVVSPSADPRPSWTSPVPPAQSLDLHRPPDLDRPDSEMMPPPPRQASGKRKRPDEVDVGVSGKRRRGWEVDVDPHYLSSVTRPSSFTSQLSLPSLAPAEEAEFERSGRTPSAVQRALSTPLPETHEARLPPQPQPLARRKRDKDQLHGKRKKPAPTFDEKYRIQPPPAKRVRPNPEPDVRALVRQFDGRPAAAAASHPMHTRSEVPATASSHRKKTSSKGPATEVPPTPSSHPMKTRGAGSKRRSTEDTSSLDERPTKSRAAVTQYLRALQAGESQGK